MRDVASFYLFNNTYLYTYFSRILRFFLDTSPAPWHSPTPEKPFAPFFLILQNNSQRLRFAVLCKIDAF
jgi:hypothetical protein